MHIEGSWYKYIKVYMELMLLFLMNSQSLLCLCSVSILLTQKKDEIPHPRRGPFVTCHYHLISNIGSFSFWSKIIKWMIYLYIKCFWIWVLLAGVWASGLHMHCHLKNRNFELWWSKTLRWSQLIENTSHLK